MASSGEVIKKSYCHSKYYPCINGTQTEPREEAKKVWQTSGVLRGNKNIFGGHYVDNNHDFCFVYYDRINLNKF